MKTVADLTERLGALHRRTQETPLFNPVFQLSLDLSRALEGGEIDLSTIEGMVAELECEALMTRAGRLRRLVAPVAPDANDAALDKSLRAETFEDFRAAQCPRAAYIFTRGSPLLRSP